jgi:hypothetical protein
MNPKPSTANWERCETIELPNATGIIWWTGEHYRAQLLIDQAACKAMKIENPNVILSGIAISPSLAKEKLERAAEILNSVKAGVE